MSGGRPPDDGPPALARGQELVTGYEVVGHLSRGRRLDVYDVWSRERDCRCVAKVIRPDRASEDDARARLLAEGYLLRRLAHPHIVRCYKVVKDPFAVVLLETLTGETLAYMLDERVDRLSLENAAWLGIHLCSAVGYIHRHGWLHLDLKPSNIVSDEGKAKLLDLSIARRPGRGQPGAGTRDYMAPEQVTGAALTPATDAWGLGAVLFEALTGHLPFGEIDDDAEENFYPQMEGRAPSLRRFRRVPVELRRAVDACLDPEPRARPGVAELSAVLQRVAGVDPKRPREVPEELTAAAD